MRGLWKKTALLAFAGFAIGVLIALGFMLALGAREIFAEKGAVWVIEYMLISGGMGLLDMGGMTIYGIERWSITRATLTHFAIALGGFLGLGAFLRWFGSPVAWLLLAAFVIVYFIIWLIMYLSYRRQVRRMNEDLKHWKDAQPGE